MKTLQFKTNINCNGCVAQATDPLNQTAGNGNWTVDIQHPDKVLTVHTENASAQLIIEALKKKGFELNQLTNQSN